MVYVQALVLLLNLAISCSQVIVEKNFSDMPFEEEHTTTKSVVSINGNKSRKPTNIVPSWISKKGKPKCPFQGRKKSYLRNRRHEIACCDYTVKSFRTKWFNGGKYLTSYFDKLDVWNCPQLKGECANETYIFNDYSRLIYAHNCNPELLESECKPVVASLLQKSENTSWNDMINNMTSRDFSTIDIAKPCVQVAIYGSSSGGFGFYHEVLDALIPFCELTWCGFDSKAIEERSISTWTCMPSRCRMNIIISMVVCGLLSLAILVANVTVIFVFYNCPKLRNSQAVYKISLAVADMLVGIVVIPTFISSLLILLKGRTSMGDIIPRMSNNTFGTKPRLSGGYFDERFSAAYMGFVGFFTTLSIVVSIYTLMMASFDRFMAIYMPLRYGRHNAKMMAIWASLILWIVGIVFSALPFFVPDLSYDLVASIMVLSSGTSALYVYSVAMVIPLVVVWISTLATYISTKRHARRRQMLSVRRSVSNTSKITSMETRLAHTLASMVGIFTLCLLPTLIVLVSGMFLPAILFAYPSLFDTEKSAIYISFEFVTALTMMTNSLWNCFIYNARSVDFKKAARSMYIRLLRRLGFNVIWRKTRSFASSTMRSRRTTQMTSVRDRSLKLNKKVSASTLRTLSHNDAPQDEVKDNGFDNDHKNNDKTDVTSDANMNTNGNHVNVGTSLSNEGGSENGNKVVTNRNNGGVAYAQDQV